MLVRALRGTVPTVGPYRRIIASAAVDTLGVGLFLPLSLYFFTVSTHLAVSEVGALTSTATLAALLVAPAAGAAVDRFGPQGVAVLSNVVTALGYFAYPWVHGPVGVFCAVFAVMAGDRLYYAAWPTLVATLAGPSRPDAWYALMQAVGSGCLGLGALVSGVVLAGVGGHAMRGLVVADAVTSLAAAALTASVRGLPRTRPRTTQDDAREQPRTGGYRQVLRDRGFMTLLAGQAMLATAWTLPGSFLSLYLVRTLGLPSWWTMVAFSVNYLLLFGAQLPATHLVRDQARTRVMAQGACAFVLAAGLLAAAQPAGRGLAPVVVVAAVVVYSVGEMLCVPAGNALVAAHAPESLRGSYMAVFQLTGAVAFGIGPGLVGFLFAQDPRLVLAAVAVLVAVGGATVTASRRLLPAA